MVKLLKTQGDGFQMLNTVGQKTSILQKRTGEVVENKGLAIKNGTKRTGKRTEEVL